MSSDKSNPARSRLKSLFTYIRELTKLRTPPISTSDSYEWSLRLSELPSYPTVKSFKVPSGEEDEFDGVLLRVVRPKETLCPKPPKEIEKWLKNGWDRIDYKTEYIEAKNTNQNGTTITEFFLDDPSRKVIFENWIDQKTRWEDAERPLREASRVFSEFFGLYGLIQRDSEKYQKAGHSLVSMVSLELQQSSATESRQVGLSGC